MLSNRQPTHDEKVWLEREQREAVAELDALAEKVVDTFESTFDEWKRLCVAEMAWKEVWKQHGCPGGRPFRSRAKQTLAAFLGVERHIPSELARKYGGHLVRVSRLLEEDQYAHDQIDRRKQDDN